jgi:serine protease Do
MKNILKIVIVGFIAGFGGSYTFYSFFVKPSLVAFQNQAPISTVAYGHEEPATPRTNILPTAADNAGIDFSAAAERATQSVVFINSISQGTSYSYWDWFFGEGGSRTHVSSGSGVIFTADGYIVTNNHVIESAERIEVNYNKRVYTAELIGADPSTDLAVIKINETGLVPAALGNTKNIKVGEWVLAVGNPFTLSSTVTAGIISAKGRRIGILQEKFPIESFIQTDAAINPGNSGGALVNKNGELVGINTAILSRTGSYTGYAFAVPVDIAKKVFDDLVKYGITQKVFFGGSVVDYDYEHAKKYDLDVNVKNFNGVLLEQLEKEGPAIEAGMKLGDIITKVNGVNINSQAEFEEVLSYQNPGDKVTFTYVRDKKQATATITLVNIEGSTNVIRRKIIPANNLGAQLESTQYGVKVFKIKSNSVLKQIGVPENFTIIAINRARIQDPQEIIDFFEKYKGRGYLYGVTSSKQQVEIPFVIR